MDGVEVGEEALLPGVSGLKGPFGGLNRACFGISAEAGHGRFAPILAVQGRRNLPRKPPSPNSAGSNSRR